MKITLIAVFIFLSSICFGQSTAAERDSVANTSAFQMKVKIKTLSAANDLLADPQQADYTKRYAQLIISEPNGAGWLTALSYGVINNPAINHDSSEGDIQFTINSIFIKYAKAYYRVID